MPQRKQGNDGLDEASRRSSDVMGAFAKRRREGADAYDIAHAGRAERPRSAGRSDAVSESGAPSDAGSGSRRTTRVVGPGRGRSAEHAAGTSRSSGAGRPTRAAHAGNDGDGARTARNTSSARGASRHADSRQSGQPKTLLEFTRQNSVFILSVVAVVAVVLLLIAFLRFLAPHDASSDGAENAGADAGAASGAVENQAGAAGGTIDWDKLDRSTGRYQYVVDGKVKSRVGIDVSDHQVVWDWDAVASDGIDFAIIRLGYRGASEGIIHLDQHYEENIAGANAAGLDCGVYFFSQARTVDEANEEADFVLEHLAGQTIAYPVVFDSEEAVNGIDNPRTKGVSVEEMTAVADAFCTRVEAAGYKTMVYGNIHDLGRFQPDFLSKHPIWWAQYGSDVPQTDADLAMWQYTSTGRVEGLGGTADLSVDLRGVA